VSVKTAAVAFTILPPVWQRWWFLTLAAWATAAAIYAAHRYRARSLVELERVRTRIALDLHDDIGSSLSRVAILSELARRNAANGSPNPEVTDPLVQIATTSRELVDSMSDIVWTIHPNRDRLRDLTQRMCEFAGDLFISRNVDLQFEAPTENLDLRRGPDERRQILLIFKECAHNIARHSGCSQVRFRLRVESDALVLEADDNGKGFDGGALGAATNGGHGLASMQRRAQSLGGEIDVASRPGRGTSVTVRAPLHK
jgi:signal transduction histidine kinase